MHLNFWDALIVDLSIGPSIQVNVFVKQVMSMEVLLMEVSLEASLERCWSA